MKRSVQLLAGLCILTFAATLCGCGGGGGGGVNLNQALLGTWRSGTCTLNGQPSSIAVIMDLPGASYATYQFQAGGAVTERGYTAGGAVTETNPGTWTVAGSRLTLDWGQWGVDTVTVTIAGNTATVRDNAPAVVVIKLDRVT